jgi:hypothetical protein
MNFNGWKMFFHWRFTWVKCLFNHLTKVRWNFELKKNGKLLLNKGFKKTFIKLLVYIYTNVQLCLNFIFIIILVTTIILKPKSLFVIFKIVQNRWNLMCWYFWYFMYTIICIHQWLTIWGCTLLATNATTFAITWVAFNFMVSLKSFYASASQCQIKNTMELGLVYRL